MKAVDSLRADLGQVQVQVQVLGRKERRERSQAAQGAVHDHGERWGDGLRQSEVLEAAWSVARPTPGGGCTRTGSLRFVRATASHSAPGTRHTQRGHGAKFAAAVLLSLTSVSAPPSAPPSAPQHEDEDPEPWLKSTEPTESTESTESTEPTTHAVLHAGARASMHVA
ncbi:hypothetical protein PMIN03_008696 [Paraphaeosphaeria minitans]|uniref:Uncharacterized protein n=1 Tax=Paraphaeosphaeria minitans TaxID=565426 RepID=A0A9P6GJ05_9PLEO|nr:hypothetical protein PMIN01_06193 [Paraphaeosphaeria minitans]